MQVRKTSTGIQIINYKVKPTTKPRSSKAKKSRQIRYPRLILVLLCVLALAFAMRNGGTTGEDTQNGQNTDSLAGQVVLQETLDLNNEFLIIVNKKRPLGNDYIPTNLVSFEGIELKSEVAGAYESLASNARASGLTVRLLSGYRSYAVQEWTYALIMNEYGEEEANRLSARPGYSEHQTGLAVDIGGSVTECDIQLCFGKTPLGLWVAQNAHNYGFIIRYPEGKEYITGYQYEPWHLRYIGVDMARKVNESGKTLEEYLGIPGGDY